MLWARQWSREIPPRGLFLRPFFRNGHRLDFETFADKLARHPEALGIGGVVRPGTGLKDPPTPPGAFRR